MDLASVNIAPYFPYACGIIATACGSWIAAQRMARSNEAIAHHREEELARARILAAAKLASDRLDGDLTKRFQLLMDGYETRIKDLTDEIKTLRLHVDAMRIELATRGPHPLTT